MNYGIDYMNKNIKNNIHVYSICYNEEVILPYFLKHYSKFAKKITIYDNFSTDNSVNIMKQYGNVEIISFDTNNECAEELLTKLRNNCWKESKSDWVIICDIDEFIYHPDLLNKLDEISNSGFTIIKTVGCQMMSEILPTTNEQIYKELKRGFYDITYSKPCIFNPNKIIDINFTYGSHFLIEPKGEIKIFNSCDIKLLHYKHISRNYEINKNLQNSNRMSNFSRTKGLGDNIHKGSAGVDSYFDKNFTNIIDIVDIDIQKVYNINRFDIDFGVYYDDGRIWLFTYNTIDVIVEFFDVNDNNLYSTKTLFTAGTEFWYIFSGINNNYKIKIKLSDINKNIIQEKIVKLK